jgi:ferredoxin-type protein NapH
MGLPRRRDSGSGGTDQPVADQLKKLRWIKWLIWVPWLALIVVMVLQAGGYTRIDPLYLTENGISVDAPMKYIVYYMVIVIFLVISALLGKRAGCATLCWMAPFMILGRWLRNLGNWPALRLQADPSVCTECKLCRRNCPMSLEVDQMVKINKMENSECILCGSCVDQCAAKAIRYSFSKGK